jgi:uncharacterized coiled-coil protein SlyX
MAQLSEQTSTIDQLKGVIQDKDQTVTGLHTQMAKLMERLSNAEAKLFEYQDSLIDVESNR